MLNADHTIVDSQLRLTIIAMSHVLGDRITGEVLDRANLSYRSNKLPEDNFRSSISARDYANLMEVAEKFYPRSGSKIVHRIGRAYFQSILREQPSLLGLARTALSFWPEDQILRLLLETLVDMMRKIDPQSDLRVDQEPQTFYVTDHNCQICQGRTMTEPICSFTVGVIEEAIAWASIKKYEVKETHCFARGDSYCRYAIARL
jgi:predicted hydrocarbon binding protein